MASSDTSTTDIIVSIATEDIPLEYVTTEKIEYTWQQVAEFFREADEYNILDIYQVCAWLSMVNIVHHSDISIRTKYTHYLKAILCASIQIIGLGMFIYTKFDAMIKDRGLCLFDGLWTLSNHDHVALTQVLSVMFAIYISFKMGGLIIDISSKGLYTMNLYTMKNCPPFINKYWVLTGKYINIIALLLAIYGSYIVLYTTDDILDVILNSVALFFILEVDDYILDSTDYQRIQEWFEKDYDVTNYKNYDPPQLTPSCKIFVLIMGYFSNIAIVIALIAAVFAPIWIAICH